MNILYVTDVFPPRCGGSGWSVYFFARELRHQGHQVDIVSLDGSSRNYDGFNVQGYSLSQSNIPFLTNWIREKKELPLIAKSLTTSIQKYDLVHAHHKFSIICSSLAGANRFFATIRDYWPICICGRSQFRTGPICSVQDFSRCSEEERLWKGIVSPLFYPWFEARLRERHTMLQSAEKIFCISTYIRTQLLPFFSSEKLTVLPNFAIELDAPQFAGLPSRFCLYVGKLEKNKGAHLLPGIYKESNASLPLVIVGEGSLRPVLENEFQKLGSSIHLLGYREYPEMLSILKQSDFLLFPSIWPEPLGRVLIEAAMMEKPAIALNREGGHRDILEDNINGILADSPVAFAKAIAELSLNAELRRQLGANARKIYEQRFSPQVILPRLLQQYEVSK